MSVTAIGVFINICLHIIQSYVKFSQTMLISITYIFIKYYCFSLLNLKIFVKCYVYYALSRVIIFVSNKNEIQLLSVCDILPL